MHNALDPYENLWIDEGAADMAASFVSVVLPHCTVTLTHGLLLANILYGGGISEQQITVEDSFSYSTWQTTWVEVLQSVS